MKIKKLEIFNNIVLLSNKDVNQDILYIDNAKSLLKYLRQNLLLISQVKKNRLKSKSRIVICFSDPYLMELAILLKKEIFFDGETQYKISIMESKDFYMNVPRNTKLVVFIGDLAPKYVSFCLFQQILLINVVSTRIYNQTNVYNLPFCLNQLSSLVWTLLFYRNI